MKPFPNKASWGVVNTKLAHNSQRDKINGCFCTLSCFSVSLYYHSGHFLLVFIAFVDMKEKNGCFSLAESARGSFLPRLFDAKCESNVGRRRVPKGALYWHFLVNCSLMLFIDVERLKWLKERLESFKIGAYRRFSGETRTFNVAESLKHFSRAEPLTGMEYSSEIIYDTLGDIDESCFIKLLIGAFREFMHACRCFKS